MLPCSQVHWKILPAIYKGLASSMDKNRVPRTSIAKSLGTTQAAISQYIGGKRGGMKLGKEAQEACRKLAKKIGKGEIKGKAMDFEIAKIVVIAKKSALGNNDPCMVCMQESHS